MSTNPQFPGAPVPHHVESEGATVPGRDARASDTRGSATDHVERRSSNTFELRTNSVTFELVSVLQAKNRYNEDFRFSW